VQWHPAGVVAGTAVAAAFVSLLPLPAVRAPPLS
jgi:hypothetical protein